VEVHRRLQRERTELLASLLTPDRHRGASARDGKNLLSELLATAIRGYAAWWHDHPTVPRERVVDSVMDFTQAGVRRLAG